MTEKQIFCGHNKKHWSKLLSMYKKTKKDLYRQSKQKLDKLCTGLKAEERSTANINLWNHHMSCIFVVKTFWVIMPLKMIESILSPKMLVLWHYQLKCETFEFWHSGPKKCLMFYRQVRYSSNITYCRLGTGLRLYSHLFRLMRIWMSDGETEQRIKFVTATSLHKN